MKDKERKVNERNHVKRINREKQEAKEQDALNKKKERIYELSEKAYNNFCEALIKKQNELGLNQTQLAKLLGLGNSIVGRYINKEYVNIKFDTLMHIALTLGLSIDQLIMNKEEYNALMRSIYIYRNVDERTHKEFSEEVNELVQIRTYAYYISPDKEHIKAIEGYEEKIQKAYNKAYTKTGISVYKFLESLSKTFEYNRKFK